MPSQHDRRTRRNETRRCSRRRTPQYVRNLRVISLYLLAVMLPGMLTGWLSGQTNLAVAFLAIFIATLTFAVVTFFCCGSRRKCPSCCARCFPANEAVLSSRRYSDEAPAYESIAFTPGQHRHALPGLVEVPPPAYEEIQVDPPSYDRSINMPHVPSSSS